MLHRRLAVSALFAVATLAATGSMRAAELQAFDGSAFEAAKAKGSPILVEVSAPWCSTCRAQKPILAQLYAEPKFRNLVVFNVDFDSRKDVLRHLGVRQQSTLIAFKGGQETARSTGDTNAESIAALLDLTL